MNVIKLLSIAFAISLFASCNKDNTNNNSNDGLVPVKFTSGIQMETKAQGSAWDNADAIGIYMIKTGMALADANIAEGAANRLYSTVTATLGTFTSDAANKIYYPVNGDAVDFIAYYPQTSSITAAYGYAITTASQTSQKAIDLLYSKNATGNSKTNTNVALTFNHQLAKVVFTLSAGAGITAADINSATVTIKSVMTDGGFNLTNGALTVGTTSGDILTLKAASSAVAEAIIVPQTTLNKVVEFKIGTEVFKWNIDKNFAAGKKYEYNVTINRTGPTVTGTIVDWSPIGAVNVNAN